MDGRKKRINKGRKKEGRKETMERTDRKKKNITKVSKKEGTKEKKNRMDRSKEKRKEERYKGRRARQEWQKERGQVQRSRRNDVLCARNISCHFPHTKMVFVVLARCRADILLTADKPFLFTFTYVFGPLGAPKSNFERLLRAARQER